MSSTDTSRKEVTVRTNRISDSPGKQTGRGLKSRLPSETTPQQTYEVKYIDPKGNEGRIFIEPGKDQESPDLSDVVFYGEIPGDTQLFRTANTIISTFKEDTRSYDGPPLRNALVARTEQEARKIQGLVREKADLTARLGEVHLHATLSRAATDDTELDDLALLIGNVYRRTVANLDDGDLTPVDVSDIESLERYVAVTRRFTERSEVRIGQLAITDRDITQKKLEEIVTLNEVEITRTEALTICGLPAYSEEMKAVQVVYDMVTRRLDEGAEKGYAATMLHGLNTTITNLRKSAKKALYADERYGTELAHNIEAYWKSDDDLKVTPARLIALREIFREEADDIRRYMEYFTDGIHDDIHKELGLYGEDSLKGYVTLEEAGAEISKRLGALSQNPNDLETARDVLQLGKTISVYGPKRDRLVQQRDDYVTTRNELVDCLQQLTEAMAAESRLVADLTVKNG